MEMRDRLIDVLHRAFVGCNGDVTSGKIADYLIKYGATIPVTKFCVGDEVRIIDPGVAYSTYSEWVFTNVDRDRIGYWSYNKPPKKGDTGTIVYMGTHSILDREIAYVEIDGMYHLIGVVGLEVI